MSKATITSEIGAGRYNVRLDFNKSRAVSRLSDIDDLLAGLVIELSDKQTAFNDAKADLSLSSTLLTNAITLADPAKITEAEALYYKNAIAAEKASSELNRVKTEKLALEKEKAFIENNLPDHGGDIIVTAWCGDYTEGLTGEVGLVDVKNEAGDYKIIQPGFNLSSTPESEYQAARDGAQTPAISMNSGAGAFRNMALHDGWELFKPLYRTGTITNINGDLCNLTLDNQKTRALGIDANREISGTLSNVQIDYMDCHGTAFNVGDQVLIAFIGQNSSTPRVIGFVDNPVPCEVHGALMTINGKNYLFRHHEASNTWAARVNNNVIRSQVDWLGKYIGGNPTDYIAYDGNRYEATHSSAWGDEIRRNGKVIATAPQKFQGAGIATYNGEDYYIIVSKNDPVNPHLSTADDFWKRPVSGGSWTLIGSVPHSIYGLAATYEHMYPSKDSYHWHFSGSGLKALHHQRIIIGSSDFDIDGDSWEHSVPDIEKTSNGDYYGHSETAGNRKAAIVEVIISPDLSSLTHTIEWTGGDYARTELSGSKPRTGPDMMNGDPPPPFYWESDEITWSSIYAVDYQDDTRVDLVISVDFSYYLEDSAAYMGEGLNSQPRIFNSNLAQTFTYSRGAYDIVSTISEVSGADGGMQVKQRDDVGYSLGGFDLRFNDFCLYKEVISTTHTTPLHQPATNIASLVTTKTEAAAFINDGVETIVGARSGASSESYNTHDDPNYNLSFVTPLILSFEASFWPTKGDFFDLRPRAKIGWGASVNTLTGGKAQAVYFPSRNQGANGQWYFDNYISDTGYAAKRSESKLSGTASDIQDLTESGDFGPFGVV